MATQVAPQDLKEGDVLTPGAVPDDGFNTVVKVDDDPTKEAVSVYLSNGQGWAEYFFYRTQTLSVSEAKNA